MKLRLDDSRLPKNSILLTCVTEEDRCRGIINCADQWRPVHTHVVCYSGENSRRDQQINLLHDAMKRRSLTYGITECNESFPAECLRSQISALKPSLASRECQLVIDISVFTKRNLFMLWQWLIDVKLWSRVTVVYSEPETYVVSRFVPLTFGLESLQQIPGSPGVADCSRPVHLVMLLGYEGDRALAVYEQIQPMQTTLIVPHPPYRPEWEGRTEQFNSDLLCLTGTDRVQRVDAIDPSKTADLLRRTIGATDEWGDYAVVICPLGTKPQTLGVFDYVRQSCDPPAVIYANPLRHNKSFFSEGIGQSWILKKGR